MTATEPETRTVRIVRKSPVAWLNLQLLVDTGFLAAISSYTGSRSPRREVMAALDKAVPKATDYFDYSGEPGDAVWIDFVADLGDGFNATHSIAWLIGRDCLGLGEAGQDWPQPQPPPMTECDPAAFSSARHVLPAGRITIFGGDLVYPYASQSEYEDRTVGPYLAARPWQLKPGTRATNAAEAEGRRLFSIPGNHDWYDGLSAYVQRFCQPGRWIGCWEVQQRRSYFAIRLPHRVWIWGVDLATEDNFDAPQLEYFTDRARDLQDGDEVILCVPKPAWVDRQDQEGDREGGEPPSPSWESWKKVERIKQLIDEAHARRHPGGPRPGCPKIRLFLSGDLHHYSRYATAGQAIPDDEKVQLITCGGGGAFLHGTDSLPDTVRIGDDLTAAIQSRFPSLGESRQRCLGALKRPLKHWKLFSVLGLTMLALVWLLEVQRPETFVTGPAFFGRDFLAAIGRALIASPVPLALTLLTYLGFLAFARTGSDGRPVRAFVAGSVHFLLQSMAAIFLARHLVPLVLDLDWWPMAEYLALLGLLFGAGWLVAGYLLLLYLIAAKAILGLHREEVFSAQAIEDCKGFLRIRVGPEGITVYPVGLRRICRDWTLLGRKTDGGGRAKGLERLKRAVLQGLRSALPAPADDLEVPVKATHMTLPKTPLAPHLIEGPIHIARKGPPA